jgi:hypothetical protein
MAVLKSGTTIGGHVAVHANNISTYALTSVPASIYPTNVWISNAIYFGGGNNYFNFESSAINSNVGITSGSVKLFNAQNFDNISRSGFYNLYNTNTGSTNPPGFDYGTMIVVGDNKSSSSFGFQLAHSRLNVAGGLRVRGMNDTGSAWSAWATVWTSLDFANNSANWNTAYGWGNHASAGYVPGARTITINGTALDLTANRSWTISTITGNAGTATTLQTARTINGTSFNGSANITTSTWGTARTITIGGTSKSVDGSGNVSWSLGEIQAEYEVPINTLRNNLGSPTVREAALFHGQFNNKFRFIAPTLQEESTDGNTWVTSTRASANALADIMIGEGQSSNIVAIPSAAVGTFGGYRLTWSVVGQTGYVFLNALYVWNSTNGNTVNITIERFHNTTGWETVCGPLATSNWPGHAYIPHSAIYYSNAATQYSQVRVTFTSTHNTNTNGFNIYGIEWFGGYPQGQRNVQSYDRDKNVLFPNAIQGSRLISTIATGTAPLSVTSTTVVGNLNADMVDGYHSSSLWRADGGSWNPNANIVLNQTGNNQEWSFDITRNGYTGGYWHVWDSANSTMLKVDAVTGKVSAPYNFVGNLEGNATTATTATTTSGNAGSATVLQTARTLTIGATGKTFDGSANVSWSLAEIGALGSTAKAADSELLDGVDSPRFIFGESGRRKGTNLITNWNQTTHPDVAFLSSENNTTNAPSTDYSYGLQYSFHRDGASYRTQLVTSLYSDLDIWVRNSRDSDTWTSWKKLWHSGNLTNLNQLTNGPGYITSSSSISGNAATATVLQTARTLTIGSTGKTFNGSADVSWTLAEIGAQAAGSYLTAEADTLATVTARGSITNTNLSLTGQNTISRVFIDRANRVASGISWYSSGYTSWATYMGPAGTANQGPTGNITPPSGTIVTSWAIRNFIENATGYGWTWESGTATGQPSIVAELSSANGNFRTIGTISASNFSGSSSGTNTGDQTTITGNAGSATILQTARTLTIGSTGKTFNGSANVAWSLAEIGAFASGAANSVDVRLSSGDGRGLRFWDSDAYKIWMSASTSTTWGGRISGETTSDYNMYFRIGGGTNRGFVFENVYATKLLSINPDGVRTGLTVTAPTFSGSLSGNFNNGNWYSSTNNLYCTNSSVINYRIHSNGGTSVFDVYGGTGAFEYGIRHRATSMPVFRYYFDAGQYQGSNWINVDPWGNDNGWGSSPTQYALAVDGLAAFVGFEDHSDSRSKSAIVEIEGAIEKVKAISGYTYWKQKSEVREAGVIAQDVLANFPEGAGGSEDGYTVKPSALIGLLMKAVKEQQEIIDDLRSRIELLEK